MAEKGTTINNVATATNDDQAVNLGQVKALAKDATVKYVSINSTDGANKLSDQAIANNSVLLVQVLGLRLLQKIVLP